MAHPLWRTILCAVPLTRPQEVLPRVILHALLTDLGAEVALPRQRQNTKRTKLGCASNGTRATVDMATIAGLLMLGRLGNAYLVRVGVGATLAAPVLQELLVLNSR